MSGGTPTISHPPSESVFSAEHGAVSNMDGKDRRLPVVLVGTGLWSSSGAEAVGGVEGWAGVQRRQRQVAAADWLELRSWYWSVQHCCVQMDWGVVCQC